MKTSQPVSISVVVAAMLIACTTRTFSASTCVENAGTPTNPSSSDSTKASAQTRAAPSLPVGGAALSAAAAKEPASPGSFKPTSENYSKRQSAQATNSLAKGSTGARDLATSTRGGGTNTPTAKSAQLADRTARATDSPKARAAFLPRGEVLISGDKAIGDSFWQPHGFRLFSWSW